MASYSDKETDKLLAELEARIVEVYDKAQSEVAKQASDYFASFKDRYEKEYAAYEEGKYTPQQFQAWYQAQVGRGERWNHLRDTLAQRLTEANKVAAAYVNDTTPGIYSLNANYQAYEIYNNTGVDFALVDENTVKRLFMDEKLDILPLNLNVDESERWNAKQLTNALTSGIIRGQSIGKIANEFQRVTNMDRTSALRNARTATTGAQNAGRQESYNKAAEMGIEIEKEWIATEDSRTRESHAEMDGVRIKYNSTFPNGLEYPGDPNGAPEEVYNCRCTVRAIIPKYNGDQRESHIEGHEGLHTKESYKEWVDRKREEKMENSKPYTHADATERAMAAVEDRQESDKSALARIAEAIGDKIEKIEKTSIENLPEGIGTKFINNIKKADSRIQELLNSAYKKTTFATIPKEGSYHETKRYGETVVLGTDATDSTIAHELFHVIDEDGIISKSFTEGLQTDYENLVEKAGDQGLFEYIHGLYPDAFTRNVFDDWVLKEEYRGISDVLTGLTAKFGKGFTIDFGYSHEDDYYLDGTNLEKESWAQFGRVYYDNNPKVTDMFESLLGNLYKDCTDAVKR